MNATNISCSRPANPAALEATARNAATGTGAPSYVSGAQNWNGTAETLNANPVDDEQDRGRRPASPSRPPTAASRSPIAARRVVPVSP